MEVPHVVLLQQRHRPCGADPRLTERIRGEGRPFDHADVGQLGDPRAWLPSLDGRITVTSSPYLTVSSSVSRKASDWSPHTTR